jgi:4,5-dihydroxyphthalate decarboxylase
VFEEVSPLISAFRRMVRGLEFDISEMALTTYICAKAHGKRFTALPIYLVRAFHHEAIFCSTTSGIQNPKDLEGKRVGINRGYTVTTSVWARSILQHQYGVDLNKITWVTPGDDHVEEFRPPANVIAMPKGMSLADRLVAGELSAAIGIESSHAEIRPLIPNADEVAFKALARYGHYPINHTLVVKDDLLNDHPQLARDIFTVFAMAKNRYVDRLRSGNIEKPTRVDELHRRVMEITGRDPLPYGINLNRNVLGELIEAAAEQKIIPRVFPIEDLFARDTHGLSA